MTSTVTNFSNNINTLYPVAGVDNDTQGFRDNFTYIQNALGSAANEISNLQAGSVNVTESTNDFYFSTIYRAELQAESLVTPAVNVLTTVNTSVSFLLGGYQTIQVSTSSATLTVTDWPSGSTPSSGKISFEIYNANTNTTATLTVLTTPGFTLKVDQYSTSTINLTSSSYYNPVIIEMWSNTQSPNGASLFLRKVGGTYQ